MDKIWEFSLGHAKVANNKKLLHLQTMECRNPLMSSRSDSEWLQLKLTRKWKLLLSKKIYQELWCIKGITDFLAVGLRIHVFSLLDFTYFHSLKDHSQGQKFKDLKDLKLQTLTFNWHLGEAWFVGVFGAWVKGIDFALNMVSSTWKNSKSDLGLMWPALVVDIVSV